MDIDPDIFIENKNRYLAEHTDELLGKHVAWSADGSTVLAANEDPETLMAEVRRRNLSFDAVVFGYIPTLTELFGGVPIVPAIPVPGVEATNGRKEESAR